MKIIIALRLSALLGIKNPEAAIKLNRAVLMNIIP